jgi:hypothetical protein
VNTNGSALVLAEYMALDETASSSDWPQTVCPGASLSIHAQLNITSGRAGVGAPARPVSTEAPTFDVRAYRSCVYG